MKVGWLVSMPIAINLRDRPMENLFNVPALCGARDIFKVDLAK